MCCAKFPQWLRLSLPFALGVTFVSSCTDDLDSELELSERSGGDDGADEDEDEDDGNGQSKKALRKRVRDLADAQGIGPMPEAPEVSDELFELGQALAFDKELSGNRDISCMTCHHPTLASGDGLSLSIGVGGLGLGPDRTHPHDIFIPRNAPPLFNLHAMESTMFWDGRVEFDGENYVTPADEHLTEEMIDVFDFGAVSAQAMFPVTSRAEMRGAIGENELAMIANDDFTAIWQALMDRLGEFPEYVEMFEAAYPGTDFEDMTFAHAANALAGFQIRGFEARKSKWDKFLQGNKGALSKKQLRGAEHFLSDAQCSSCHNGDALTDLDFHNTALPQFGPGKGDGGGINDDFGRERETDNPLDTYKFRTPPLRNVAQTGPWGHTGQFTELEDFVAHYVDPVASLQNYDVTQIDERLQDQLVPNTNFVLSTIAPEYANSTVDPELVDELTAFLESMTDKKSLKKIDKLVPDEVPSGLPVADDIQVIPENRAGTFRIDMGFGPSGGREYQIQEQSMCDGEAYADVSFDRNANLVAVDAHFDGLPYRPDYCYDYDPSTPWNDYPLCVEDGKWQMWLVGRTFSFVTNFWYDGLTGELIGSEYDTFDLPPTAFPVALPTLQMLCSPLFEADPNTLVADVHFEWDYDQMLDGVGSGGVLVGVVPANIFNPAELDIYYTDGGLAPEDAMNFDDMIEDSFEGKGGFMLVTSLEPDPKPDYLIARDNIMIGWGGQYPGDLLPAQEPPEECGTSFQWDTGFNP